ncbi:MAG TPA: selenoneine synthase SenA [Kofleriaceae bacterium]|jgi:iron(II)-dependent oxidoreductase
MPLDAATLASWVADARRRTLELYADRSDAELAVPYSKLINPPVWELGHIAWFQEFWVLRGVLGEPAIHDRADELWDSARIAHAARWTAPLPSRAGTREYLELVRERVVAALARGVDDRLRYFTMLSVCHEDMHAEAVAYTRQTLGWPGADSVQEFAPCPGDVTVAAGRYRIGAEREPAPEFVFDNEKWAHDVELAAFAIARAPVTQAEFAAFVDAGGYAARASWSDAGWAWREAAGARQPLWWRGDRGAWERRVFDRWIAIAAQPHRPMLHVNAHEAEAWCRWAGRRLPSEAEWEVAARGALPMRGHVWEWTATAFGPYPGFERDPYAEYSEPWFGDHRVLRGGCFATQPRLLRPTWRNFYTPDRRDVWSGFRTCAPG